MQDAIPTELPPAGKLLVLSPHLDDAAFGCGRLLASVSGAVVATVFAGRPAAGAPLTDWDRAAGFEAGEDVVGRRREEDRQALAILGGQPHWLDLRDSQYGGAAEETVTARLRGLLALCRPDALLIPLGLFHSDHRLTHRAALALMDECPGCRWLIYEDALYRAIDGLRDQEVAGLRRRRLAPRPVSWAESGDAVARKRDAVACYRSQLRALATPGRPGQQGILVPEAYWEIFPARREPP